MAGTCARRVLCMLTLITCSVSPSLTRRLSDDDVIAYRFAYSVQDAGTGDSKGHFESREGDVVRGSYSLVEPDGSRRTVEYVADPMHGFNAVIRRESPSARVSASSRKLIASRRDSLITRKKYRYPKRGLDQAFAIAGVDTYNWLPPSGYRSGRGYLLPGSAIVTAGAFVS